MKGIISICFILLFSSSSFAQYIPLKLYVEDAEGRKDSLVFGLNDTSTLGIDTTLGEVNMFGTSFDSLDIRAIQRDSVHFNCIRNTIWYPGSNLYFPENIDSKIDFRPFGSFSSVYNNFEIFVHAIDYPLTVTSDFSGIAGSYLEGYSSIVLLDENCDVSLMESIATWTGSYLFTMPDSFINTIVAHFEHEVAINGISEVPENVIISPNPVSDELQVRIKSFVYDKGEVSIYDLSGRECLNKTFTNENFEVEVSDLISGVYFLQVSINEMISRQKFLKQ